MKNQLDRDMDSYQKWLAAEKAWIGTYCKKMIKRSLFLIVPLVLVIMAALGAALGVLDGGGAAVAENAFGMFFMGVIICFFYLLIVLPGLWPGRYVHKIESNVKKLGLNDMEKEALGKEMLEADEAHRISYSMVGPKSKSTPARFVLTPHFAFLEGSSPYSILVRLSDIAMIRAGEEEKDTVQRGAKTKTYYHFTLYTIGFYRKDRKERNLEDSQLPDEAYGFFDREIRDRAMKLLEETGLIKRIEYR